MRLAFTIVLIKLIRIATLHFSSVLGERGQREEMSGGRLNLSHCPLLLTNNSATTRKCQVIVFAMTKAGARGV